MFARIAGVGGFVPGEPVTNQDLVRRGVDTSDEWIITRTGIRARHLAGPGTLASDLALEASRRALSAAETGADELDLIIVATSTPDCVFPGTSCILQTRLGNRGAMVFDLQAACSGFIYALNVAEKLIRAGSCRKALVVGAEIFSRILDWNDRATCVLFGDGAGAVVLEASEKAGILASVAHADGSYHAILSVPGHISDGKVAGDPFLRMDGQAVFRFAVRALFDVALECCSAAKVSPSDIDWFIPHQANLRIIDSTAKKLGIDSGRIIVTLDAHGNTSAASIPLALDAAVRDGRIRRGQKLLLEGVGGGFTWGAALLEF
ncbi:MAG: ketoacyl-ACP synthase III [Candidatus Accumulibacter sp.]|jgi:3-oxoacyl-[acyl-carrier-protein] synthase-3|nr:ketoacyl-ACP synthase III [Accumulibacter sp.]